MSLDPEKLATLAGTVHSAKLKLADARAKEKEAHQGLIDANKDGTKLRAAVEQKIAEATRAAHDTHVKCLSETSQADTDLTEAQNALDALTDPPLPAPAN